MNVAQLIAGLQKLDPETVVVKFGQPPELDYHEVHFMDGTHTSHGGGDGDFLKVNRAKWVKGIAKPEYVSRNRDSKAKPVKFVVLY